MTNLDYLKVAVRTVKTTAPIFTRSFGRAKNIKFKNSDPRNLVTEVDKKIESEIRKIIGAEFPGHKIIGEEFSKDLAGKNDLVWIIDPIDGTTNYVQGLPICCISVGLWQGNRPLAGAVYNPVLNQLFTAASGQGAFLNGKKISVSKKNKMASAFGGFGWGRNIHKAQVNFPKLLPLLHKVRTLGSATMEMCLVAAGIFDFHIQSEINVWDFAAAAVILQEAGGRVTELGGKPLSLQSSSFLASNGKLHGQMVREFKKTIII